MPATSARQDKEIHMNASDFRIESVRTATINGSKCKVFKAFRKDGDAFVFCGEYSAPAKTAARDLWKIAAEAV
jgi:hypothetical protein